METKINIGDLIDDDKDRIAENERLKQQLNLLQEEIELLKSSKNDINTDDTNNTEFENLKKEQDDLLVLLADQDAKIREYKMKLRELGIQVGNQILNKL